MPYPSRSREHQELTVLRTIQESLHERGYPPSQREITAAMGLVSPSGANALLKLMEADGLVEVTPGIPRGLRLTDAGVKMIANTVPM